MDPYDTPTTIFDRHFGPRTALTPKIVAHGGGNNLRILKGNPVGYVQHPDGSFRPYLSARGEHSHLPQESAMIQHARFSDLAVDHYHLGQIMPAKHAAPVQQVRPSSQYRWPDTSIAQSLTAHPVFGGEAHPGGDFGPAPAVAGYDGNRRNP